MFAGCSGAWGLDPGCGSISGNNLTILLDYAMQGGACPRTVSRDKVYAPAPSLPNWSDENIY